jgi:hypothetical protein
MVVAGTWLFSAIAFLVVSMALLLWIVVIRRFCVSPRSRNCSINAGFVVFSTAYTLVIIELMVSLLVVHSEGLGITLAARRWGERYWFSTINSFGYRDHEPKWSDHLLVMVGASFVAGAGIEKLDDRMSGVLGRRLGPGWTVAIVGDAGWDTERQFEALLSYPKTPDVIVVSHTINDFEKAAAKHGLNKPQLIVGPPAFLKPLVEQSSLGNWLFWRFSNQGAGAGYWAYATKAYESPEIFAEHVADILRFKSYAESIKAKLCFVIWPSMANLDQSEEINRKVSDALKASGARVLELAPYLRGRSVSEITVNSSDPHPNARVHGEVGNLIFEQLREDGVAGTESRSDD